MSLLETPYPESLGIVKCENPECGTEFVCHYGRFAGDENKICAVCGGTYLYTMMTTDQCILFYKQHSNPKTNTQKEEGNNHE
jgi:hypothetical protein